MLIVLLMLLMLLKYVDVEVGFMRRFEAFVIVWEFSGFQP
jgi:hypothetical protein